MTKYIYFIPILLLLAGLSQSPIIADSQSGWQWSTIELISSDNTTHSFNPIIASDSMGNIYIVWWEVTDFDVAGTDYDVYYKKWDSSLQTWSIAEIITSESTGYAYKFSIAIDRMDNIHFVWEDTTDYDGTGTDKDIYYKKLDSKTQLWSNREIISPEFTGSSILPNIVCDDLGNIHVVWTDTTDYDGAGTDYDIFYRKLDSKTQTWSAAELVSTDSTESSAFPQITIDDLGDIHTVWRDLTDYDNSGADEDIFYKKWDHTSQAWSNTKVVSTESTSDSKYPKITNDNGGNIHIIWQDTTDYGGSGISSDIFYKKWDPSSQSWGITEVVSTESSGVLSAAQSPSFAIDSFDTMHVVWIDAVDYNGAGNDNDIFYKKRTSEESTWGTISYVLSTNTGGSYNPSICLDNSEFLHLGWQDNTNYSNSGTDEDIFYTKFSGPPSAPFLQGIQPNPNDGIVNLVWDDVFSATSYSIYRDIYPIYSTVGLTPIAETSNSYYVDEIESGGTYYYTITANNPEGSSLSNTVYVQIEIETETVTENYTTTINEILTELSTEISIETDGGFVDYPLSIPLLFGSITLVIMMQRRKRT